MLTIQISMLVTRILSLITRLAHDALLTIEWFESKHMKLNQDKYHFLFWGHKHETLFVNVGEVKIWESKQQKLLGVFFDKDLKFDIYVLQQCIKADKNLSALIRINKSMTFAQKRNIMKVFIEPQFGYYPLVWMFCGRQTNVDINHTHERVVRVIYNLE